LAAFRRGLKESGYVEGRNVVLAIASAENASDRLPALANELVHRGVGVIAAAGTATARTVMNATASIPIVFVTADDPIDNGLATNLNRPPGNATGVSMVWRS
jgi:putative tryptophan/tyrosine transport system substrate-binding protein